MMGFDTSEVDNRWLIKFCKDERSESVEFGVIDCFLLSLIVKHLNLSAYQQQHTFTFLIIQLFYQ